MVQQTLFGVEIPEVKDIKEEVRARQLKGESVSQLIEKKVKGYAPQRQKIIEEHLGKVKKHNLIVKARKPVRKKGKITIRYDYYSCDGKDFKKGDKFTSVDFSGHNEGSGSPMKDEEVEKYVQQLYQEKSDNHKVEIVDERIEQRKQIDLVKGKKIIVEVKYGWDCNDERDFFVSDNRREMGIESCLGGAGSSAYKRFEKLEDGEKEAVNWIIKDVMDDGIPRENIEVIQVEMNDEDLSKHEKRKADRRKSDLEYAEKDIKNYSEKLKKALEVKYGYKVKINVVKDE